MTLPEAVTAALSTMTADEVRREVERAIWRHPKHGALLTLAEELAPGARWDCDPEGLAYPLMQGDHWFAGVCLHNGAPALDLAVGASPDPEAAGWQRRPFPLTDIGVARIEARLWLGLRADSKVADSRVRARAESARRCLAALGWM